MCCSFGGNEGFDGGDYSFNKGVVVRDKEEIGGHKGWGFRRIMSYGTKDTEREMMDQEQRTRGRWYVYYGYEGTVHIIDNMLCYVI